MCVMVSTLATLFGVAYYVMYHHDCENNTLEWNPCTESMCKSVTLDPSVYVYRNASHYHCDTEYKLIVFPSDFWLQESLCPTGYNVEFEADCTWVATNLLNKEGAYQTNNARASKCYYDTITRSVHYNPYDHAENMNPQYLAICKSHNST